MKKTLLTYRITVMVIGVLLGVLLLVLGALLKPETVQTIIKWGIIIYGIFIVLGNIPGLISGIANIGKPTGVFDLVCALLGIGLGVAMICYQGMVLVAIVGIYLVILPLVRVLLADRKGEQFKRELIRIILGVVLLFFVLFGLLGSSSLLFDASDAMRILFSVCIFGGVLAFLCFNRYPAKIFMGDTGSMFLGYMLAVMSINGLFKLYAVISFVVPFLILGLPIFDTLFAIIRRIIKRQPIMAPDRGHLHHRLIDMGFGHKQSVRILYSISGTLGIAAVLLMESSFVPAITLVIADLGLYVVLYFIMKNKDLRKLTGLENIDLHPDDIQTVDDGK